MHFLYTFEFREGVLAVPDLVFDGIVEDTGGTLR
jgi:hypothetical protein